VETLVSTIRSYPKPALDDPGQALIDNVSTSFLHAATCLWAVEPGEVYGLGTDWIFTLTLFNVGAAASALDSDRRARRVAIGVAAAYATSSLASTRRNRGSVLANTFTYAVWYVGARSTTQALRRTSAELDQLRDEATRDARLTARAVESVALERGILADTRSGLQAVAALYDEDQPAARAAAAQAALRVRAALMRDADDLHADVEDLVRRIGDECARAGLRVEPVIDVTRDISASVLVAVGSIIRDLIAASIDPEPGRLVLAISTEGDSLRIVVRTHAVRGPTTEPELDALRTQLRALGGEISIDVQDGLRLVVTIAL
jgi:hypothetical protein